MCSVDEVYVVFERSDTKHLLSPFLDKEINHCFVVVPYIDRLIALNKSTDSLDVYTVPQMNDILQNNRVIKTKPIKNRNSLIMLDTCVGSVKQYLGINNPFILTPLQLFRSLYRE